MEAHEQPQRGPRESQDSTSDEIYKLKVKELDYFCVPEPPFLEAQPGPSGHCRVRGGAVHVHSSGIREKPFLFLSDFTVQHLPLVRQRRRAGHRSLTPISPGNSCPTPQRAHKPARNPDWLQFARREDQSGVFAVTPGTARLAPGTAPGAVPELPGFAGCAGCSSLRGRGDCLAHLPTLPQPQVVTEGEVLTAPHGAERVRS